MICKTLTLSYLQLEVKMMKFLLTKIIFLDVKMDDLSGRQLQAGAEAVLRSGKRIGGQNYDDQHPGNEKTSDSQSLPKKKTRKNILWEKNIIYENGKIFP